MPAWQIVRPPQSERGRSEGRVRDAWLDVCNLEFWISRDDFGGSLSVGEKPQNQVSRDAQAANTRLAIALLGVYGNSVKA
jgi:hypothetical protein